MTTSLRRAPDIRPYRGKHPQTAPSAYIDPAAVIIGDVVIGEDSSVWPCSVIRGDVHHIRIGARTNIQDGCVLHVMRDEHPLVLGDDVTTPFRMTAPMPIKQRDSMVPEGTKIPPGSLVMGSPGKVKRPLREIEKHTIDAYAQRYVGYKEIYREEPTA